jgi:hypothetical protein
VSKSRRKLQEDSWSNLLTLVEAGASFGKILGASFGKILGASFHNLVEVGTKVKESFWNLVEGVREPVEPLWKVEETCGTLVEGGRDLWNPCGRCKRLVLMFVWPQHPSRTVEDWSKRVLGGKKKRKKEQRESGY